MKVSILIPTYNRIRALIATLVALSAQTYRDFEIVVSDQSESFVAEDATIQTLQRLFKIHGNSMHLLRNLPNRGIAQQRQFLLERSKSDFSLFLDDDIIMEPDVLARMVKSLDEERCGFAGMAPIGLSYVNDIRPQQQHIEFWESEVQPEIIRPGTPKWNRYPLHNAANILHVSQNLRISAAEQKKYKIAWIGGCILYDTLKLRETGGFTFWQEIPERHSGEDVLAQIRLMEKYGGFGIIPSGAFHLELPTTIPVREVNAPELFYG